MLDSLPVVRRVATRPHRTSPYPLRRPWRAYRDPKYMMRTLPMSFPSLLLGVLLGVFATPSTAGLADTIARINPSIVAVGTYLPLRGPNQAIRGTAFVVAGHYVVTNAHTVPEKLDAGRNETLAIFIPLAGDRAEVRKATAVRRDDAHDLCLLRVDGAALPQLRLAGDEEVREGQSIALTGFPILNALGLHPATHTGIVAAVVPVASPVGAGREISRTMVTRLDRPFDVYQLDAVSYPGNSGSPVYDPDSGRVLAVINSTFVKKTKEAAIADPSGISFAIPVRHVRALLDGAGVKQ